MKPSSQGQAPANFRFFCLLLLALGTVLLICTALYRREVQQTEQRINDRESSRADLLAHILQSELRPVVNDLRTLADGDGLRGYLLSGLPEDLENATRRAVFFSRERPTFDQVRYIDERGQEIIRVNHGGEIVSTDRLQNKFNRAYFQNAIRLDAGQVHVSAFDLNIENRRVEKPFKPVLRFSIPVFDSEGRRRGLYVINYLGKDLLDGLHRAVKGGDHRLRVLNAKGYWLKAAESAHEWGFMFPERAEFTLARSNPPLWARMAKEPEGQTHSTGGIFTWKRVTPTEIAGRPDGTVVADEPFIVIASEVTPQEWTARLSGIRQIFLIVTPGLLLLVSSSAWFFRSRQRATETLRRSEVSLAVTLNSIGDGVLATDIKGNITHLNRVAEHLTGWKNVESYGKPFGEVFRIVHEQTRQPALISVAEVLAIGKIKSGADHTVLIARDGTERAVADSAAPIHDQEGQIIGLVLVFRDVSEERAAEAKLTAARSQLDRFFTLSLDFLCISSADGYFKRVSPAVTDILGWSVEEFLATPYIDFVHPEDLSVTLLEVERQIIRKEKVLNFENRYRHKNGSWRVLSWRSAPQPDGLMYATARDVTEARGKEAEIKRLNEDLRQHAAQLEAANKELESFSYSVSHDLRAPLRHVQGYVDMLGHEAGFGLSEKGFRYLKVIAEASRSMGQLIDDLLSFSRMGRLEMTEEVIDLDALVRETLTALESVTSNRNIEWKIPALPATHGDAALLRQVLLNLLGNAVKYTRGRDPAVIEIGCAGLEHGYTVFFVRDNGAGFNMQYVGKLFGVFQRLHRADEFEGTGIGLANVRRIITRHGGRIWAEGKPGAGATFYFTLKSAALRNL